jgi:hypothetical protein
MAQHTCSHIKQREPGDNAILYLVRPEVRDRMI